MKSRIFNSRKIKGWTTALVTVLALAWIIVMTYLWGQPQPVSR